MNAIQTMVDVLKYALIHLVHINAVVIQDITKMDLDAKVSDLIYLLAQVGSNVTAKLEIMDCRWVH